MIDMDSRTQQSTAYFLDGVELCHALATRSDELCVVTSEAGDHGGDTVKPANTIVTEVAVHVVAAGEQGPPGSGFNPDSLPAAGLATPDEIIVKQSGVWAGDVGAAGRLARYCAGAHQSSSCWI